MAENKQVNTNGASGDLAGQATSVGEADKDSRLVEGSADESPTATEAVEDEDIEAQLAYENIKREREARKRKRALIIAGIIVAVLVVIVVIVLSNSSSDEEKEIDPLAVTSTVYRGDFATTITANGATVPAQSTVVTPEVEGIIENVQVAEGSTVKEGDVLFTIKADELDKEVRAAEQALEKANRGVATAAAAVDEAYAAYTRAWDECNEADDWSAFDEASLNASITAAQDAYTDSLQAVEEAKDTLKEAKDKADKRTVRAPVSGDVVVMNAVEGASTAGSSTSGAEGGSSGVLIQIADLSQMRVTVEVNEVDIINVKEDQVASVTFSALPDVELKAKVERISTTSSGSGGDVGGIGGGGGSVVTYGVTLLIEEPDPDLKPGMTATVNITTQSVPNTLIVPVSALMEDGEGGATVTVVDDDDAKQTHEVFVTVIEKNTSEAAVESSDLKEGDQVMLGGSIDAGDLGGELEDSLGSVEI